MRTLRQSIPLFGVNGFFIFNVIQVCHIESLAIAYDVEIMVERKKGMSRINISGERDDVTEALKAVLKKLQDVQTREQEKEAARLIANQVSYIRFII